MSGLRPVKAVQCYKTTDNKEFDPDKRKEALAHQQELNRIDRIAVIMDEFWTLYDEEMERGTQPSKRMDIPKFLNLKRVELKRALR